MEKTTYYQLNKPEAADPLRVADFNENADKIDGLLKQVDDNSVTRSAQVRSEAANALAAYKTSNDAAVAAVNTAVGTKAEQSAVDALNTAVANVAGRRRVVAGSFVGPGTSSYTLPLDFTPSFVLIVSKMNNKPFLNFATPVIGVYFDGSTFIICPSKCVENGVYISGNASNSPDGNYYLAVE